jgi:hypothetical protein
VVALIRTFLIWLLVLAAPAQGAVAVTMALCAPSHHGGAVAPPAQPQGATEDPHRLDKARGGREHLDEAAQTGHDKGASDLSAASLEPAQGGRAANQTCSACASCCPVGAIPSAGLGVPAPAVTFTVFGSVVSTVKTSATDGPDRPPRLVLA